MIDIADVTSIVALIISCILYSKNKELGKKLNEVNLESQFYVEIFKDYLLKKLPESRNELYFNNKKHLKDYDKLANTLMDMKKSALYFDFRDHEFYRELKRLLEKLEDQLISSEGKVFEGSECTELLNEIDKQMRNIYSYIIKGYFGN